MHATSLSLDTTHPSRQAPWSRPVRPWNPLHDDLTASSRSNYLGIANGQLRHLLNMDQPCSELEIAMHRRFAEHIRHDGFPCVVAKSILNRSTYRMGIYDTLASTESALALCHDLYEFSHEFKQEEKDETRFTSFIAIFRAPHIDSELAFEQLLWRQLQAMHSIDARYFDWDRTVSKEPESPNFSFSLGGRAFFVVGMNPRASRLARRPELLCLVFNPHEQFEALRVVGKYEHLRNAIRKRDVAFQGTVNPMLDNFGQDSESRQYSGRAVPAQWQCPFQPDIASNDDTHQT